MTPPLAENPRIVGFVPSKLNSARLPRKNVLPLAGIPLINYVLRTLQTVDAIDETVVYASDDEVMKFVTSDVSPRLVLRPAELDTDEAKVGDFVGGFLTAVPCDIVVLLHATSPFITPATVNRCLDAVVSGAHEAAFVALEQQRFAWYDGRPLNYDPDAPIPRTQDLQPVIIEQSGCYVFTRELFERTGRRVDADAKICVVDAIEGHDIDEPAEFAIAELLATMPGVVAPA